MKTLENITEGFATCSVQVLRLDDATLFFNKFDTDYMTIERKVCEGVKTSKVYRCEVKFLAAISRYIKKQ